MRGPLRSTAKTALEPPPAASAPARLPGRLRDWYIATDMRLATWNINGLKARLGYLLLWLEEVRPDVVGLPKDPPDDTVTVSL